MSRLTVYRALGGLMTGYVLDVQADRLDHLKTRTLVPLLPRSTAPIPLRDLNPVFQINGVSHIMATQYVFTALAAELSEPVAVLDSAYDEVRNALDCLFESY